MTRYKWMPVIYDDIKAEADRALADYKKDFGTPDPEYRQDGA
jgi:hypothetical protein